MKSSVANFFEDFLYCIKLSLKISLIPIALGLIITTIYSLVSKNPITIHSLLMGIRNTGIITSCFGLFICAAAFLKPETLGPLDYQNQWRMYFVKFNLIGAILCICALILFYFLMYDVVLWNILNRY
jgi:ABC-type amino acid transport system permease subunit